jgi:phosphate starvation-inducible PhoH-like protein
MSEATLTFADHDQVRALFGPGDQHLRRIREALGIDVVVRGDQLKLQGQAEHVQHGVDVIRALQEVVGRQGRLDEEDLRRALGPGGTNGTAGTGSNGTAEPTAPIAAIEKVQRVKPRTPGQAEYVDAIRHHDLVFCRGPAGCGKTYLAVAMAVAALRQERVRKIVLVRPAVEAGERLGFLPGDMLAKVNPYLRPLLDALHDILDYDTVKLYMEKDVVEVVPMAFMRGRTLNHTFIILDEAQNTTITQMKMFLTRMGQDSKIVVTGDTTQIDLPPEVPSGMIDAWGRLGHISGVAQVELTTRDIVRHRLVKEIVAAYDEGHDGSSRRHRSPGRSAPVRRK